MKEKKSIPDHAFNPFFMAGEFIFLLLHEKYMMSLCSNSRNAFFGMLPCAGNKQIQLAFLILFLLQHLLNGRAQVFFIVGKEAPVHFAFLFQLPDFPDAAVKDLINCFQIMEIMEVAEAS